MKESTKNLLNFFKLRRIDLMNYVQGYDISTRISNYSRMRNDIARMTKRERRNKNYNH